MIRKINDLAFRLYYKILCNITLFITWVKFKVNNVTIEGDFIARGTPVMRISLSGRMIIGSGFQMNSGVMHNTIGRPQRCSFVVGENACLSIGNNVGISSTAIVCKLSVVIESDVRIGAGVVIYDTDFHSLKYDERTVTPEIKDHVRHKAVVIKKGAFIGGHSTILKGVTIGEKSIIGAGSVVSKSVPPNEIWAGNPARFVKALKMD